MGLLIATFKGYDAYQKYHNKAYALYVATRFLYEWYKWVIGIFLFIAGFCLLIVLGAALITAKNIFPEFIPVFSIAWVFFAGIIGSLISLPLIGSWMMKTSVNYYFGYGYYILDQSKFFIGLLIVITDVAMFYLPLLS